MKLIDQAIKMAAEAAAEEVIRAHEELNTALATLEVASGLLRDWMRTTNADAVWSSRTGECAPGNGCLVCRTMDFLEGEGT